ncbi:DUF922 domain-containing protein [Aureisphaera galaxeae]|uniref:DUF922 domain-containing protein n=1 Tax=Aureisphaera galaxeae TaxID=1538023 RepID=UPI00234FBD08|nr:DUF922 domain-containing protein [Aureisphaera galaxeae]MDC8005660.1 DUF922 domain-containing protein [Aureisphaera galaxeae]
MKKISLFPMLFLVAFAYAQEKVPDSVVVWNPTKKLMWTDFQGEVGKYDFGRASTSYKIVIVPETVLVDEDDRIQGYEKMTAKAHFYKTTSWTATQNYQVLVHERLHFDIAELFARKVRKRFAELKAEKEARFSVYYKEYNAIWKECRSLQKQYDSETNHGRNLKENEEWATLVNEELELFKAFE